MIRRCVTFALGLVLLAALAFAMAHLNAARTGGTAAFSAPCEPASRAFSAADGWKIVSGSDAMPAAAEAAVTADPAERCHLDQSETDAPALCLLEFPPLFHRPPPVNS